MTSARLAPDTTVPRLSRELLRNAGQHVSSAPARIAHLGLGSFHRAHQAWYTAHAADADEWGIIAFTGRSPGAAEMLSPQGGLYTLIERGAEEDRHEIVPSIVAAVDGSRLDMLTQTFRDPALAIVTMTVTESGYRLRPDGLPDRDAVLARDLEALAGLAAHRAMSALRPPDVESTLGRLLLGLMARRASQGPALALVPCDNIPGNGSWLQRGLLAVADLVDPRLAAWVSQNVSFVSTSVDRITPATTAKDVEQLNAASAWRDLAPVVTEPFADWVLSGTFPAGRPAWETAGARFVDAIEPWERRKLWLLNGAHTLLSFAGPLRGHQSVAEAIADPLLANWVQGLWDDAARQLGGNVEVSAYRTALLERFANPRIEHRLSQIAQDGALKLRLRVIPVAEAERRAGRIATGAASAVAAWVATTWRSGPPRSCHHEGQRTPQRARLEELVGELSVELGCDEGFLGAVAQACEELR